MLLQLYLHIPFCKQKCLYCDFCSGPAGEAEMTRYAHLLEKEIAFYGKKYEGAKVPTVFLGGGTPSLLPCSLLEGVLRALTQHFELLPDVEFTAEANPGALSAQWLEVAGRYGLNRLSLGMQAAQDRLLKSLGRIHTKAQAEEAVHLAQRMGLTNINLDVMFGLPGQSLGDYLETLEMAHDLGPTHLSAYSLILEEGTPLCSQVEEGLIAVPGEDEAADMYEAGVAWMGAHGYAQYEISNFARPGFECKHNMGYWQGAWYLGMGLAAHSMLPDPTGKAAYLRMANPERMEDYALLEQGLAKAVPVSQAEARFETLMLGLRTAQGVSEGAFFRRHGLSLAEAYGDKMRKIEAEGLGRWEAGRFALTPKGLLLQNSILVSLME